MNKNRATDLALDHWKFIYQMLKATDESSKTIKMIGVYYRAAFIHGHKHGLEEAKEAEKAFREILEGE